MCVHWALTPGTCRLSLPCTSGQGGLPGEGDPEGESWGVVSKAKDSEGGREAGCQGQGERQEGEEAKEVIRDFVGCCKDMNLSPSDTRNLFRVLCKGVRIISLQRSVACRYIKQRALLAG